MSAEIFRHKSGARTGSGIDRFKTHYFQLKIKEAREYQRAPRIAPQAKTGILLDRFRLPKRLVVLFVTVILAAAGYGLFFSGVFDVKNISITGTEIIPPEVLQVWVKDILTSDKRYYFFPANNLLLLDRTAIEESLKARTARIAGIVEFHRKIPNSLQLKIQERNGAVIFNNAINENYLLSKDGVVLEKVPASFASSTEQKLLILRIPNNESYEPGQAVPFKKAVEYALLLRNLWRDEISSDLLDSEMPTANSNDLYLKSTEGWSAYFDLGGMVEKQIQSLGLILDNEIPLDMRHQLAYVDLRVPEIVYYCYYNEPCSASEEPNPDSSSP